MAPRRSDEPVGESREDAAPGTPERRAGRRRTYNRRIEDHAVTPPYFEAFDRIATALEHIEEMLRNRSLRLPDAEVRAHADQP